MRRAILRAFAAGIVFVSIAALASQAPLFSPNIGTVSGLALTNSFNNAIDSLNTCNSGATAPTNQLSGSASLGNCWIDTSTSPNPVKRNDGNGHWVVTGWIDPTNGIFVPMLGGGSATVSSATTTDIGASPQTLVTISGTTTITSLGSSSPQPGLRKTLLFSGALTLTYNATSLILPGAANIPTAAGDVADAIYLGGGNWRVLTYTRADGTAVANPAVAPGTMLSYSGMTAPTGYAFAFGQTFSRASFPLLLANITSTQSVTRTSGSPTLTGFTDTTQFGAGMKVEGTGIPVGDTISSCSGSTCTLAVNASTSGTANVTVYPWGNGDGSTTFNGPDCQGRVIAGRDNMSGSAQNRLTSSFFGSNASNLGVANGSESHTLTIGETPSHNHGGVTAVSLGSFNGNVAAVSAGGNTRLQLSAPNGGDQTATFAQVGNTGASVTIALQGGGTAHAVVQPTLIANCIVRTTP